MNTLDRISRTLPSLVGPFCCILCLPIEENMNHLFWRCEFARTVWDRFFQRFDYMLTPQRMYFDRRFLLHPPFSREGTFLVVCECVLRYGVLWGERIYKNFKKWKGTLMIFRPRENPDFPLGFYDYNYSLRNILLSWSPFFSRVLCGLGFF